MPPIPGRNGDTERNESACCKEEQRERDKLKKGEMESCFGVDSYTSYTAILSTCVRLDD